ncbi:hypothetical protein ACHAQH_008566 [Verticillium albo-atrum]
MGDGIVFDNHPHAISDVAQEVVDRETPSTPQTPDHRHDLNQLRPDQICVYRSNDRLPDSRTMVFVAEYKPPHKLTAPYLRLGLRAMNIPKDVVNCTTIPTSAAPAALFQYHAERLTASAVTRTYRYMIEGGLEYGLPTTGEAIEFLKVDWEEPERLYYHLAEPVTSATLASSLAWTAMDGHTFAAYHAHDDLFARFWANGLAHASRLLGGGGGGGDGSSDWLRPEDWETLAELDEMQGRHRFYFRARCDVDVGGGRVLPAAGRWTEEGFNMDESHRNAFNLITPPQTQPMRQGSTTSRVTQQAWPHFGAPGEGGRVAQHQVFIPGVERRGHPLPSVTGPQSEESRAIREASRLRLEEQRRREREVLRYQQQLEWQESEERRRRPIWSGLHEWNSSATGKSRRMPSHDDGPSETAATEQTGVPDPRAAQVVAQQREALGRLAQAAERAFQEKKTASDQRDWCNPIPAERKVDTVQAFLKSFHDESSMEIATCSVCYMKKKPRDLGDVD